MERVLGREAQPAAQSLWLLACKHCCFGSLGLFRFVTWQARHREAEPCPELQGRDGASVSWGRGLGGGSDAGPTTPGRGARGQTHIWGGILAASLRRRHMPKKGLGWARGVRVGGRRRGSCRAPQRGRGTGEVREVQCQDQPAVVGSPSRGCGLGRLLVVTGMNLSSASRRVSLDQTCSSTSRKITIPSTRAHPTLHLRTEIMKGAV